MLLGSRGMIKQKIEEEKLFDLKICSASPLPNSKVEKDSNEFYWYQILIEVIRN